MPSPVPKVSTTPLTFAPADEILLIRTDRLREDVRRLHPLLDLLDPPEGDETTLFAGRLVELLERIEASYQTHARAYHDLEARLASLDERLALLLGETD